MRMKHLASPLMPPSEMGEKVRQFPWEDTPLGPILSWPATLRIAVDMLLVSKVPTCLVWGAQLSTIYNDAFNEMLGKRQVLGCSFDDVLGESWEKVGPILFKALSGEATLIENLPLIINRNGASEPSYFTFSCTPVRDESGAIVGVLDKVIETTAHVQSEQQWRMLAFAHEQQVRARTADLEHLWQLSGGMAQDVKNLLGGICSSLALLEQRLAQGHLERLDTCIESARVAANQAVALADRLLAFSCFQALAPQPVNVTQLIDGMAAVLSQSLGSQITLQMHLELLPWTVLVDVEQLQRALQSLCLNACDALPNGGRVIVSTGNVRYDACEQGHDGLLPGDYTYVQVEDNGCGMGPEAVVRAFEPFFTGKPAGQGHGLGLTMIYGFVRQSGGRALIESEPGKGTRVRLLLPRHLTQD
ncbi:two-component system sensor histidine kinase NtrB [Pseudomonas sp. HLS-6 TE3448]